jgi:hypothetical protein
MLSGSPPVADVPEERLPLRRLERGEAELASRVPVDDEVHARVAQVADAIEEDDGVLARGLHRSTARSVARRKRT